MARLYGGAVQVRYHDVSSAEAQTRFGELIALGREERWPLPWTLIDGELAAVGGVQPLKLVAQVARHLEARGLLPQQPSPAQDHSPDENPNKP